MNSEIQHSAAFSDDSPVLVWYPPLGADHSARDSWAWLPGSIISQCTPDEWSVVVEVDDLGEPDPDDPNALLYPLCFRCVSELRAVTEEEWWERWRELANG
jgi:hypothetical protein